MRIGIVGSGIVGRTLAGGLLKSGHEAMLGTRDLKKPVLQKWLADTPGAKLGTFEESARFGSLIVLATLGRVAGQAIEQAGVENFADKTVMDATNPLADAPPVDGVLVFTTGPNESLSERIQAQIPDAHVVKAFNSVGAGRMINPSYEQGPPTMFYCGNNVAAKAEAAGTIREFGWEPFDCGTLRSARALELLCMLWSLPGLLDNRWTHAFKLRRTNRI